MSEDVWTERDTKPDDIDYEAIRAALFNVNQINAARLVKTMSGKHTATHSEILNDVYDGSERDWGSVKTMVNRTNNALMALKGPQSAMARRLKFKVADLTVIKTIKPA